MQNWMGELPHSLRSLPLAYIAIPGSHDSFTYSLRLSSTVGPDQPAYIRRLVRVSGPIGRRVLMNWSRTEDMSAVEQLNIGVRYLDFRLVRAKNEKRVEIIHGLYGAELEPLLKEIRRFLGSHLGEVVILDFQHFYKFDDATHAEVVNIIRRVFGCMLCPVQRRVEAVSLNWMAVQSCQVIAIYRHESRKLDPDVLWPTCAFPNPWPNTVMSQKLVESLDAGLRSRADQRGFFISQGVLTPNFSYVARHIFSTLKASLVPKAESLIMDWIMSQSAGEGGVNILMVDSPSLVFCREVIRLNYKLLPRVSVAGVTH
ncbi:unnamed protein product [Notodromas monacha]|uniref:Phosphatidylinositol-specific phospholipase C X domain-containing protein n=1 Tax=Notodromas monacha TaxID=399045 RepID=A0A7R9BN92_9CRUS|nr:unnamed protein product [Notodromas monacha]CAG0917774.1 unnamed protein product [Notodromas monacha]